MNEITGAQVLAEMLQGYGVTHMFMVPAILRRTLLEIERRTKIQVIRTHGEKSAAYMADGYARASGRPGVCAAQVVGALNIAAGLRDAWLAHSPVIAFTGGRDPKTNFKKAYQEVDDVPSFAPVTKFNATIDSVERFPDMLRQAFRVAVSGTPGPVHLQFRGNEGQIDGESAAMQPLCEDLYARVPPFRPEPELSSILAALELLQKAERPLIVAGGGVRWSGAQKEVVALAEALGIPVATSLNGKGTIPGCHPLSVGVMGTYSRESANRVVQQADLIFYVGSEAGGMTTNFWTVPAVGVPTIQVDINPEVLGRTYPLKVAICGDVKVTMRRMLEHVDRSTANRRLAWNEIIGSICREWYEKYQPFLESDAVPIRPGAYLPRIDEACAGRLHRPCRYRPCGYVDGWHVRYAHQHAKLSPQLWTSRLGFLRRTRRQVRLPGPPGSGLHRRCRPLVPHRRDRNCGAARHQHGDRRQQQSQRQSVEARLRPHIWRQAK